MKLNLIIAAVGCLLLSSCVSYSSRTEQTDTTATTSTTFGMVEGVATAYVAANGVKPFDGTIFRVDVIPIKDQPGELVSIELWPLLELGVGIVGVRLHVLPFEAGAGVLFYYPRPRNYWEEYTVHEREIHDRDRDVDVNVHIEKP